jgi:DAK2 domain fusion protein YloV
LRERIDAAAFKEMFLCANAALEENKQIINDLNVFPVPDGDTGTNMSLTMNAAAIALSKETFEEISAASKCAANALLRGARGNSGVILSLLFRGISKSLKGKETADAKEFAGALTAGVEAAYKAVMKPAEGTILTVSRMAAAAAVEFSKDNDDVELMFECLLKAARDALAETIHQNPVLERAGVVDAGGQGFVVVMDAMLAWMQGRVAAPVEAELPEKEAQSGADFSEFDTGEITFTYCTEFIAARESQKSPELLRTFLENIGDCVVVVPDDEIIKVHVHTNVPGEVLTEALTYGPLQTVKIENMRNQHTVLSKDTQPEASAEPEIAPAEKPFGVVTVCAGDGMAEIFAELGADRIVTGGQTMNPSTEDILTEVNKTPAETVFVLPNNKNIVMAAEQCARLTDKNVVVVPTKTVPQGVAAMLAFDADQTAEEIAAGLQEAAGAVHTVLVTYAARDSDFDGHDIHAGEYLALLDGALVGNYTDFSELMGAIAGAAAPLEPEIISVYYGEDVTADDAALVGKSMEAAFGDADVNVVSGGQPVYYYMISLE